MIETVQDLIDELNKIEDKSLSIQIGVGGNILPIESIDVEPIMNRVFIWPHYGE